VQQVVTQNLLKIHFRNNIFLLVFLANIILKCGLFSIPAFGTPRANTPDVCLRPDVGKHSFGGIMKTITKLTLAGAIMAASTASFACTTDETASNDTDTTATSGLCSGVLLQGDISSRRDVDWFSIEVAAAGSINITLDHNSRDDFDWDVYPATGNRLGGAASSNVPETGSVSVSSAGTYFVKVSRYAGTGWYDLTVDFPESGSGGGGNPDPDPDPVACNYGPAPSTPGGFKGYVLGNAGDACTNLTAGNGAVLLMGGGADVDSSFSQNVKSHVGSSADVVVLRTSGTDAYNDYLSSLMGADSVNTMIIDTVSKANSDYVEWAIKSAEFVFVSGGDQSEYLNLWAGTKVQSALQHVFDKGGVIGGTSAGMAMMSSTVYDPDGILGAISDEVVTDLCHETLNFSAGMLNIPAIANTVTDTHFQQRDRMGRAMVFLANQPSNHKVIAASEGTALFVKANGDSVAVGDNEVYVLYEGATTDLYQGSCGQAVIYDNVNRIKLLPSQSINLNTMIHNGDEITISVDGRNNNYYSPSSPY
jgi:cyanophycinase